MTDQTHYFLIRAAIALVMIGCAWFTVRFWPETENYVPDTRNLTLMQIAPVVTGSIAFGLFGVLAVVMVSH